MDAHAAAGTQVVYEAEDVSLHGLTSDTPSLRYTRAAQSHEITCDFIAGCDGFHGVSRQAIPQDVIRIYERVYPFGWLGILADTRARQSRADLRQQRARVRAVHHALDDAQPLLSAGARSTRTSTIGPTNASGAS